jgi:hypothetical protein
VREQLGERHRVKPLLVAFARRLKKSRSASVVHYRHAAHAVDLAKSDLQRIYRWQVFDAAVNFDVPINSVDIMWA